MVVLSWISSVKEPEPYVHGTNRIFKKLFFVLFNLFSLIIIIMGISNDGEILPDEMDETK